MAAALCMQPWQWPLEHLGLAAQASAELGEVAEVGLCRGTAAGLVGAALGWEPPNTALVKIQTEMT